MHRVYSKPDFELITSVTVFFAMVPSISRLLHRQTFLQRLRLPPTHPNFPHVALLHAICAVSARYSAAVRTLSVEDWIKRVDARLAPDSKGQGGAGKIWIEEEIAMEECFGERNAKYAQLEARLESASGRKLVDVVQAMVRYELTRTEMEILTDQALMCYYSQQHAEYVSPYTVLAVCCLNQATPLIHLQLDNRLDGHSYRRPSLYPPRPHAERTYRRPNHGISHETRLFAFTASDRRLG